MCGAGQTYHTQQQQQQVWDAGLSRLRKAGPEYCITCGEDAQFTAACHTSGLDTRTSRSIGSSASRSACKTSAAATGVAASTSAAMIAYKTEAHCSHVQRPCGDATGSAIQTTTATHPWRRWSTTDSGSKLQPTKATPKITKHTKLF